MWKSVGITYSPQNLPYTVEVDADTEQSRLTAVGSPDTVWGLVYLRASTEQELIWGGPKSPALDPDAFLSYKLDLARQVGEESDRRVIESPGFEFPIGSGMFFSMAQIDQGYWNTWQNIINTGMVDLSVTPFRVRTKDNLQELVVSDNATGTALFLTAAMTGQGYQAASRDTKRGILAAVAYEEADQIFGSYTSQVG